VVFIFIPLQANAVLYRKGYARRSRPPAPPHFPGFALAAGQGGARNPNHLHFKCARLHLECVMVANSACPAPSDREFPRAPSGTALAEAGAGADLGPPEEENP
jgi:hypothetical protein